MSSAAEINPPESKSTRRISIYKQAHGKALGNLSLLLAGWARKSYGKRADFPIPKSLIPEVQNTELADSKDLRLNLLRAKEMKRRPGFLHELNSLGTIVTSSLLREVPSLTEPQKVKATGVKVGFSEDSGETFVSLVLDKEDGEKILDQREGVLRSLESTAEVHELNWTFHTPDLRIGYFEPNTIDRRGRELLEKFISPQLPVPVILAPAKLPEFGSIELDGLQPTAAEAA